MRRKFVATVMAVATVLALTACEPEVPDGIAPDSVMGVSVTDRLTSLNPDTVHGAGTTNAMVAALLYSSFAFVDDTPALVANSSFGTAEIAAPDPMEVDFTLRDGQLWSDGVIADAADLMLAWAARSGHFDDDLTELPRDEDGSLREVPSETVAFDAAENALQLVAEVPEVREDMRGIRARFAEPFVDWRLGMTALRPAHVLGQVAFGERDPMVAKQRVLDAILRGDRQELAEVAEVWRTGYDMTETPSDARLLVGNGQYLLESYVRDDHATLVANARYVGDYPPKLERIRIDFTSDARSQLAAVRGGDDAVFASEATAELYDELDRLDGRGFTRFGGPSNQFLQLQYNMAHDPFTSIQARRSFSAMVNRAELAAAGFPEGAGLTAVRDSFAFMVGEEGYSDSVGASGIQDLPSGDAEVGSRLRAEAGVLDGTEVCVVYDAGSRERKAQFELLAEQVAEAGWRAKDCGSTNWREALLDGGSWDVALVAVEQLAFGALPGLVQFLPEHPANVNGYRNPDIESLYVRISASLDPYEPLDLRAEVDGMLMEQAYGLPISQLPMIGMVADGYTTPRIAPFSPHLGADGYSWAVTE